MGTHVEILVNKPRLKQLVVGKTDAEAAGFEAKFQNYCLDAKQLWGFGCPQISKALSANLCVVLCTVQYFRGMCQSGIFLKADIFQCH